MNPLESLLRPLTRLLNRNIGEVTPARELCRQLDGKVVAVRVRDTGLAMYFCIDNETIELKPDSAQEPDVVITGSLVTLAGLAGTDADVAAVRRGALDVTGDAYTAQAFQQLLQYTKPDPEEELSRFIGDAAAHRAGAFARGLRDWATGARDTLGSNVREYLQEESRELPSRYEVERFGRDVDALRDAVARLEARINRLEGAS